MKSYGSLYILGAGAPLLLGTGELNIELKETKVTDFPIKNFHSEIEEIHRQWRIDNVRWLGLCRPRKSKCGPRRQRSVWVLPCANSSNPR